MCVVCVLVCEQKTELFRKWKSEFVQRIWMYDQEKKGAHKVTCLTLHEKSATTKCWSERETETEIKQVRDEAVRVQQSWCDTHLGAVAQNHQSTDYEDQHELKREKKERAPG